MKSIRDQEMQELDKAAGLHGNDIVKSTKQKQIEYLKQIKFNGFSSTNNQSKSRQGLIAGADPEVIQSNLKEQDIVRDLLYVFQGIEGKLI